MNKRIALTALAILTLLTHALEVVIRCLIAWGTDRGWRKTSEASVRFFTALKAFSTRTSLFQEDDEDGTDFCDDDDEDSIATAIDSSTSEGDVPNRSAQ